MIWVQHSSEELKKGSDKWRIVPELSPSDAEPLVEKNYSAFIRVSRARRHRNSTLHWRLVR